jgi:DNA-binding transcriptional regulator YiaG
MIDKINSMPKETQPVDSLIKLLKNGDALSLTQLRINIGVERSDLASDINVTERTLAAWESGKKQPSASNSRIWKIKLGSRLDVKIASYLGTQSLDLIHKYWALIWELVD